MTPLLTVENISVSIDNKVIIKDVSLIIEPGEIIGLVGPNGGGKSTLVKAILGLVPTSAGKIKYDPQLHIGYLPQRPPIAFDIPITVRELWQIYGADTETSVDLIERLQIHHLAGKQVRSLSGGELQKVFLIIAIADNPQLLILDEPSSNIDTESDQALNQFIAEEKAKGKSILIISHDIDSIAQTADNLLCLQQQLICVGKPNLVLRSQEFQQVIGDHHHHHH